MEHNVSVKFQEMDMSNTGSIFNMSGMGLRRLVQENMPDLLVRLLYNLKQ